MSNLKKKIREAFRLSVFNRDGNRCRVCKAQSDKLDAHHITDRNEMPNGGYVKENGISLCPPCHEKAEEWHNSGKTKVDPAYHPDALYRLVDSDLDKAVGASMRLSMFQLGNSPALNSIKSKLGL